jgi:Virulence factor membrane-bound polymerase, C-terminal
LVLGSIGYFLWRRWQYRQIDGGWWWAWVFPLPVAVHSMFELPLWYTYFLFPVLFSLGLLSGTAQVPGGIARHCVSGSAKRHALLLRLVMIVLLLAPVAVWRAQQETHELYVAQEKPFFERMQLAQSTFWVRQHADHALLNSAPLDLVLDPQAAVLFPAVGQVLIDAKLLRSWAMNCAAQGGGNQARRLAYAAKLISMRDFDRWRSMVLALNEPKLAELQTYLRDPVPVRVAGDVLSRRDFCRLSGS